MRDFPDMLWVETRKAWRSWMPLLTTAGSLLVPVAIAFLILVATHPEVAGKLGLIGAKANLVSYASTDWPAYLGLLAEAVAVGVLLVSTLIIAWTFGREWMDGTLKDLLAVPVPRGGIVLAKFVVTAAWSAVIAALMVATGLAMGALIGLPGGSSSVLLQGGGVVAVTACLTIVVVLPFAFFASAGRGYLLPIGVAILVLILANVAALLGWGPYFPWAVPGSYVQDKGYLAPVSLAIALLTGLAGILATYVWWKYADQNR